MEKDKKKSLEYFKLFKPLAKLNSLTLNAKLVAMYIYNLHSFGRTCTASNNYMSKVLNISSSSVDEAIKSLRVVGMIADFRKNTSKGFIEICKPEICDSHYYKFYSTIINSDLKTRAKFLLAYILSYHKKGQNCYSANANILGDIGLSKDTVNFAIKELQADKLIVVLNPGKPQRELRIPIGTDPLEILNEQAKIREAEKVEQAKKKKNHSSLKLVSHNPENSTKFPENSTKFPEYSTKFPEYSTNNRITKRINKTKNNKSNNRKEKIKTNNNFLTNSLNSIIDTGNKENDKEDTILNSSKKNTQVKIELENSQPLEEVTIKTTSSIIIDDIIKNISKIDENQMDGMNKFLQLVGISTSETLPSIIYNLLKKIGDLSNYLSEDGKILITSNSIYPRNYLLVTSLGEITEINLPPTPLWYDERMFQQIEFKQGRIQKVNCDDIVLTNGLFLKKIKSGEINYKSIDYNKELLEGLDRFIIPTSEYDTQIINDNDILSSSA